MCDYPKSQWNDIIKQKRNMRDEQFNIVEPRLKRVKVWKRRTFHNGDSRRKSFTVCQHEPLSPST